MLKKKGAPSFKPKAGIRRNVHPPSKGQSSTPAPVSPGSEDTANTAAPVATPAYTSAITVEATAESTTLPRPSNASRPPPERPTEPSSVSATITAPTPPATQVSSNQLSPTASQNLHSQPERAVTTSNPNVTHTSTPASPPRPSPIVPAQIVGPSGLVSPTAEETALNRPRKETAPAAQPPSTQPENPTQIPTADPLIDPAITGVGVPGRLGSTTEQPRKRKAPGAVDSSPNAGPSSEQPTAPPAKRGRQSRANPAANTAPSTEPDASEDLTRATGAQRRKRLPASSRRGPQPPTIEGETAEEAADDQPATAPKSRKPRKPRAKPATTDGGETHWEVANRETSTRKRTRKNQTRVDGDGADDTGNAGGTQERAKQRAPKKRRDRSETPEDAEDRAIDPKSLTMAELTQDLRIGKKFSRHDELRDRMKELAAKQRDERRLKKLTEAGLINPTEEGEPVANGASGSASQNSGDASGASAAAPAPSQPVLGPQFEIINGQIVVNKSSLVHDRHAAARVDQEDMEVVEENDFTRMTNSATYLKPNKLKGPNNWNKEETAQFYDYLRMFGTDFQTIANMFPGRMRRHVKMKFNREEKHNPAEVNAAIVGQKVVKIDLGEYQTRTGKELEATEAIEEEHRKRQEDHDAEQRRIQEEADALQAEKRNKLLGTGKESEKAPVQKKKDTASVAQAKAAVTAGPWGDDDDVEIIDEDEVEARPPPRRRPRGGGIGN